MTQKYTEYLSKDLREQPGLPSNEAYALYYRKDCK